VNPSQRHLLLALAAATALSACGASVQTAARAPGAGSGPPGEAYLVQVAYGSPGDGDRVVSLSVWDVNPADALPAAPPEDVVATMREHAAERGATRLWLERVEAPRRKAFFGLGTAPDPDPGATADPTPCAHAAFADGLIAATRAADRCLAALLRERPALRGEITVVFQVDAWGAVMRAAPTPESTRDGMAQRCAVDAVHDADFGAPIALTCEGSLTVTIPTAGAE
jgi:hypothetical protein